MNKGKRIPPSLDKLTRSEMALVIKESRLDSLNEDIAEMYLLEGMFQIDIAADTGVTRRTVHRRLDEIFPRLESTAERMHINSA